MTDHAEQVWAWLREPLQRLAQSFDDDPETEWSERVRELLDRLGLGSVEEHPVAHSLLYHLETLDDTQRQEFLVSTDAEFHAREVAGAQVVDSTPDEQALRELTDQAYHWVVTQLTEEDPAFPQQLEQDPGLAQAIYTEAAQRVGLTPAG